jgi:putative hydrolase of the HAD superfamily
VLAVLFDADGVLQVPRPGWLSDFVRLGGPNFVVDAFAAERECLAGGGDLRPLLQTVLDQGGTGTTVDEILTIWHDIVIDDEAIALVDRVRRAGLVTALATNQQSYRGTHMREVLDFDRHFDRTFYSYEVGYAKPSVDYFSHIVEALAVPAAQVAFVDDAPANVVGARAAGLRAALHRTSTGAAGLADQLRALGVPLAAAHH